MVSLLSEITRHGPRKATAPSHLPNTQDRNSGTKLITLQTQIFIKGADACLPIINVSITNENVVFVSLPTRWRLGQGS